VVRREEKKVSVKKTLWQQNPMALVDKHVDTILDSYVKHSAKERGEDEEVHVEMIDLPMGNGIALVRMDQLIGTIIYWDGTVYVGKYEVEEHPDRSSGRDEDRA
jgi:hypothetical protein